MPYVCPYCGSHKHKGSECPYRPSAKSERREGKSAEEES